MITIYPEKIDKINLHNFYFLIGENVVLLQESQYQIIKIAKRKNFDQYLNFFIDKKTDWNKILILFREFNIFFQRQIILLDLSLYKLELKFFIKQFLEIFNLLNKNIILIIKINHLHKKEQENNIIKKIIKNAIIINCDNPQKNRFYQLINYFSEKNKLKIEDQAKKLLYYYYEGNLFELVQIIEFIKQIWPNELITLKHVQKVSVDSIKVISLLWIESLFNFQCERSLRILKNMVIDNYYDFCYISFCLQKKLILSLKLMRNKKLPLKKVSEKYFIPKNYQEKNLSHLNENQIFQSIKILNFLINNFFKLNKNILFMYLEKISYIMCYSKFTNFFDIE